jgi:protein-disulfide isomerase
MRLRWLRAAVAFCLAAASLPAQTGLKNAVASPAPVTPKKPAIASGGTSGVNKAILEEYVRHLFVWGPQITVKVSDPKPSPIPGFEEVVVTASAGGASQDESFYISRDGQQIIRGVVFNIRESPFAGDLKRLKIDNAPAFGPAAAPVTLVIFSDFECGFCKEEAKVVRDNVTSAYPKEVRVVFKDFPLEPIHPWAKSASVAGRCVFRQNPNAFWDYHDWMFEHQGDITAETLKTRVLDFAKSKGLDPAAITTCMDGKEAVAAVENSQAQGRSLGINSTPTLFINGRKLVGQIPWQQLRQIIDYEIGFVKAHPAEAESCCEVKIPSPTNH